MAYPKCRLRKIRSAATILPISHTPQHTLSALITTVGCGRMTQTGSCVGVLNDASQKSASGKLEIALALGTDSGESRSTGELRCVEHTWADAADTPSPESS